MKPSTATKLDSATAKGDQYFFYDNIHLKVRFHFVTAIPFVPLASTDTQIIEDVCAQMHLMKCPKAIIVEEDHQHIVESLAAGCTDCVTATQRGMVRQSFFCCCVSSSQALLTTDFLVRRGEATNH